MTLLVMDLLQLPWCSAGTSSYPDEVCTEESRLARAVPANPDSFTVLYDRYYARILNYFHHRMRDRDRAEDLTAQTFISAFDYLCARPREIHFRGWIYRVAHNNWVSHLRKTLRWKDRLILIGYRQRATRPHEPLESLVSRQRIDMVHKSLLGLPSRYREPVLLRLFDELDYDSIAAILGISSVGVRSRVSRGLEILRRRLRVTFPCGEDSDADR